MARRISSIAATALDAARPVAGRVKRKVLGVVRRPPEDSTYGGRYYGEGRDPLARMGLSGYERYDRDTSNADVAAFVLWRHLPATRSLDVGCATGFVVEALAELGVDSAGVDVSGWAVENAALGARGRIRVADLVRGLPHGNDEFDLVTALETLEHLPPETIPDAVAELARVSSDWVVATIPSFGHNRNGPDGWFQVKVRDERVAHYESLGPDYTGPVPYDDLYRDTDGEPIEGHLTIASYDWWEAQFAEAGLVRVDSVERRMHRDLYRFGMTKYWNLYVLRHATVDEPDGPVRSEAESGEIERRWGLDRRSPQPDDAALLGDVLDEPAGPASAD